jgi:Na+-driven multidrug efflux pump
MRSVSTAARVSGIAFAALCIAAFEIFSGDLIRLFINDPETVGLGSNFLRIACVATPFMITNIQMTYTLQAMGKGRESLILSACRQGIANIPLLFIMNAVVGLYGLIWTQLLADGITLAVSFGLYFRVQKRLRYEESGFRGEPAKQK